MIPLALCARGGPGSLRIGESLRSRRGAMRPSPHHGSSGGPSADPPRLSNLSVDFANTVGCEACRSSDALASAEAFLRWNRAHPGLPSLSVSDHVLRELKVLRRDLRDAFECRVQGAAPRPALLRRINRWLGRSSTHLRVGFAKGRWHFEEVAGVARPEQRWESTVARAGVSLLGGPLAPRLRKCQAPGCAHFLVGRKSGQLWCSPTGCGNRVRVARHYRKQKRETPIRNPVTPPPFASGRRVLPSP